MRGRHQNEAEPEEGSLVCGITRLEKLRILRGMRLHPGQLPTQLSRECAGDSPRHGIHLKAMQHAVWRSVEAGHRFITYERVNDVDREHACSSAGLADDERAKSFAGQWLAAFTLPILPLIKRRR